MPAEVKPYEADRLAAELEEALAGIIEQAELSGPEANIVRKFLVLSDVRRTAEELGINHTEVQRTLDKGHVQKNLIALAKNHLTAGPLRMARILQRYEDWAMANITDVVEIDEEENRIVQKKNVPERAKGAIRSMKINTQGSLEVQMEDRHKALEKLMDYIKLVAMGIQDTKGVNVNIYGTATANKEANEREIREINATFKSIEGPSDPVDVEEED